MPNGKSSGQTLELDVPTYLPLSEAANKFDLSESVLTQLIQAGKIEAVRLPSGELLVPANESIPRTKQEIITEMFAHLCGQAISASEASRKYSKQYNISISNELFSRWGRLGYIKVLGRGYRLQLDEADVAYCASVYAEKFDEYKGQLQGVPIFDEDGNPYQLKHVEEAEQKRASRRADRKYQNGK